MRKTPSGSRSESLDGGAQQSSTGARHPLLRSQAKPCRAAHGTPASASSAAGAPLSAPPAVRTGQGRQESRTGAANAVPQVWPLRRSGRGARPRTGPAPILFLLLSTVRSRVNSGTLLLLGMESEERQRGARRKCSSCAQNARRPAPAPPSTTGAESPGIKGSALYTCLSAFAARGGAHRARTAPPSAPPALELRGAPPRHAPHTASPELNLTAHKDVS